jgi:nitrogen regulatory protein PII
MYKMIVLVLDDVERLSEIVDAWVEAGVTGVTILNSAGIGRSRHNALLRDDVPMMPSINSLLKTREEQHRTMFALVDNTVVIDDIVRATQDIVGDLTGPNRGVLFVLPVSTAIGIATEDTEDQSDR